MLIIFDLLDPSIMFYFSRIQIIMAADQAGNLHLQRDPEAFPGLANQMLFVELIICKFLLNST